MRCPSVYPSAPAHVCQADRDGRAEEFADGYEASGLRRQNDYALEELLQRDRQVSERTLKVGTRMDRHPD
jgi:hypothetical protein